MRLMVLFAGFLTACCCAQEITAEGIGELRWGATLAEAEKVFPTYYKSREFTLFLPPVNRPPCDLVLSEKPKIGLDKMTVLLFYDEVFIGALRTSGEVRVPGDPGLFQAPVLEPALKSAVEKAIGAPEAIDVFVSQQGTTGVRPDGTWGLGYQVLIVRRDLAGIARAKQAHEHTRQREAAIQNVTRGLLGR